MYIASRFKSVTTDNLRTLLRSKVDFEIQEYIRSLAFAFAIKSKLFDINLTDEEIAGSDHSVHCADYTRRILEWDAKTECMIDAEDQLERLLTVKEWKNKDIPVAKKRELRKKRKKEWKRIQKDEYKLRMQKWMAEYIRLFRFVNNIMKDYFGKHEIKEGYLREFYECRYLVKEYGAQSDSVKAARVKTRKENAEKEKEIERKRMLGFAIFILIKAKLNDRCIPPNTVARDTFDWWMKNSKIEFADKYGKSGKRADIKRRYFPEGLTKHPLFQFINAKLQSDDKEVVEAIKALPSELRKDVDMSASSIALARAVELHDAAAALYRKKNVPPSWSGEIKLSVNPTPSE